MKNYSIFVAFILCIWSTHLFAQNNSEVPDSFYEKGTERNYWLYQSVISGTVKQLKGKKENWIYFDVEPQYVVGTDIPISTDDLTLKYPDNTFHGGYLNNFSPEKNASYLLILSRRVENGKYHFKIFDKDKPYFLSSSSRNKILPSNISAMKLDDNKQQIMQKVSKKLKRRRLKYYNKNFKNLHDKLWNYIRHEFESGQDIYKQSKNGAWLPEIDRSYWYNNALVSGSVTSVDRNNGYATIKLDYIYLSDQQISTKRIRISLSNEENLQNSIQQGKKYVFYLTQEQEQIEDTKTANSNWSLSGKSLPVFPSGLPIQDISKMSSNKIEFLVLKIHAMRMEILKKNIDQLIKKEED